MEITYPICDKYRILEGENEALLERLELLSDELHINSKNMKNLRSNVNWLTTKNKQLNSVTEARGKEMKLLQVDLEDLLKAAKTYEKSVKEYECNEFKNQIFIKKQNAILLQKDKELSSNKVEKQLMLSNIEKLTQKLRTCECNEKSIEISKLQIQIDSLQHELNAQNDYITALTEDNEKLSLSKVVLETEVDRLRVLLQCVTYRPKQKKCSQLKLCFKR